MKIILSLLLFASMSHAQTFVNYKISQWKPIAPNTDSTDYTNLISIEVPQNTLLKIVSITGIDDSESHGKVFYPESETGWQFPLVTYSANQPKPPVEFLGSCRVTYSVRVYDSNQVVSILARFDTVNQSPDVRGLAVQPASKGASVELQTSADLQTWNTATNGTYPATNSAQFYRLKMSVE
jgi:hypothetical protein